MKKLIMILSLFSCVSLYAAIPGFENASEIKAPISGVTVYSNTAYVERNFTASLAKGETLLAITDLPVGMVENTLSVKKAGDGAFLIKEFEYKEVLSKAVFEQKEKELRASLEAIKAEIVSYEDKIKVNESKIKALESINAKSADEVSKALATKDVSVTNLDSIIKFAVKGLEQAYKDKRAGEKKLKELKEKAAVIESELSSVRAGNLKRNKVLFIRVDSSAVLADAGITVKYAVYNSGWYPSYEANYTPAVSAAEVAYNAVVYQQSGEEWKNVKLTVSTGNKQHNINIPEPAPWILRERQVYKAKMMMSRPEAAPAAMAMDTAVMAEAQEAYAEAPAAYNAIMENELSMKVEMKGRFNVPSNGEPKSVFLKNMKFDTAGMYYSAVPSRNDAAYLTAEIENKDELSLMPGEMAVYLDGDYSGKQQIGKVINTGDKLTVSFGIDENIKIKREITDKKTGDRGLFGNDNGADYGFKITVENFNKKEAQLEIKEPMPVSQHDKIKVEVYKASEECVEKDEKGICTLKFKLGAGQKKVITYRVKVTYPKDMNVEGL
ncbi:MAG: DUF4139 domain-containing protein [Candidatus Goldbacteria bacterium]|nr:DUF4139 domain-containing protein [Candidatus Goldiibacteriota bacterium]